MPDKINLTGTSGATYNLEEATTTATRTSSSEALIVEIWEWNPNLPAGCTHSKPNPSDLTIGRIWMSKLIPTTSPRYTEIYEEYTASLENGGD